MLMPCTYALDLSIRLHGPIVTHDGLIVGICAPKLYVHHSLIEVLPAKHHITVLA